MDYSYQFYTPEARLYLKDERLKTNVPKASSNIRPSETQTDI